MQSYALQLRRMGSGGHLPQGESARYVMRGTNSPLNYLVSTSLHFFLPYGEAPFPTAVGPVVDPIGTDVLILPPTSFSSPTRYIVLPSNIEDSVSAAQVGAKQVLYLLILSQSTYLPKSTVHRSHPPTCLYIFDVRVQG